MKPCVLGHRGMVGQAFMRALGTSGAVLTDSGDLRDQRHTRELAVRLRNNHVDTIFCCAARVGGIQANMMYPAEFIEDNLRIELNVIEMGRSAGARLVYLGSSCIYPRDAKQPISEDALLTGALEPSNEPYAVAKIAGINMLQAYEKQYGMKSLILMPCNLYGPWDNFDLETGHVLPSLIRRFVEAKESGADHVTLWGTGRARREFMHVDDMVSAALYLVERGVTGMVNVGVGKDHEIMDLAHAIASIVRFKHSILVENVPSKPDGTPAKLLDLSRLMNENWYASERCRSLGKGIAETVAWYREHRHETTKKAQATLGDSPSLVRKV